MLLQDCFVSDLQKVHAQCMAQSMEIIDLRRSIDLTFLFDPVLNSSLDDLVLEFSPNRYAVMRLEAPIMTG